MFLVSLKDKLASLLSVSADDFVYPIPAELGDLSLPLFALAKSSGMSPAALAQEKIRLLEQSDLPAAIQSFQAVGPYLNFFFKAGVFNRDALSDIEKAGHDFGRMAVGRQQRIMLEYSNANTHKEYHIGHLRNLFFGDAVYRILAFNDYQAIPVSYINDFGIHVAKTLWQWQRANYKDSDAPKGWLLGKCYAEASGLLSQAEAREDGGAEKEEIKKEISAVMKEVESRQGKNYELWQETRDWSIAYFAEIYQRFDVKFEHIFYESEVIGDGLKMVAEFLQKGILKNSQGAVIADLEEYGLGVLPIIRSDGTALYPVADLALAKLKFNDYHLDESVYVVDIRQGLYFKQLAKIFELAGETFKISHLGYDFVTLKSGMMSSRSGNVITYSQIWEEAYSRARQEVSSRHQDWESERAEAAAEKLAVAALKFEMLKVSADKVITFDVDEALRFDGFTAAYLQYTGARLASILRKEKPADADYSMLSNRRELSLTLAMQRFPEVVAKTGLQRDPSILARYLFELSQIFNDYYHEVAILKAEPALRFARLGLLGSLRLVLENGFALLGFDYLEEM
ncbi:MAG: arginine--tRNA ligase [Patescibacteria group bacterium]|nr:arginine--tRNA ligase [Patescibacteria group bacterium]